MKDQPPISELLKDLRDETTLLLRQEIQLAKAEASEKASKLIRNTTYALIGGLVAYSALHFLLLAVATVIAHFFWQTELTITMSFFFGSLIVALVVGIVAFSMIGKAKAAFQDFTVVPERTVNSLKSDKQLVERKLSHDRS